MSGSKLVRGDLFACGARVAGKDSCVRWRDHQGDAIIVLFESQLMTGLWGRMAAVFVQGGVRGLET
jgi:hypothetical protein